MKAHHAADILAQIVAALAASLADATGQRAIHDNRIAGLKLRDVGANGGDLSGRLGTDHERHFALGKSHAAPAPYVDVIERDCPHADLHFARGRRGRRRQLGNFELAVGDERECPHAPGHVGSRPITSETFCPPKPKELDNTCRTLASRATFGTTSSGMAGSGT